MFSILVSELTPGMLAKADWWKFYYVMEGDGIQWADVRHRSGLDAHQPVSCGDEVYGENVCCFPVSLSPDGTETRLECPRMPDEVGIQWSLLRRHRGLHGSIDCVDLATIRPYKRAEAYWSAYCPDSMDNAVDPEEAPTPEHSPRLTLEGTWVWSTRR